MAERPIINERIERAEELIGMALARAGNAGPGGAGPMTTFVYDPGGTTAGNVFGGPGTSGWAPLVAAAALVPGPKRIEITRRHTAVPNIPAGVWAISAAADVELYGDQSLDGGAFSLFQIAVSDGATFPLLNANGTANTNGTCIGRIQNIRINWSGVGTPPITLSAGGPYGLLANYGSDLVIDASTIDATGTTSEFIRTTGAGFGRVILENDGILQGGLVLAARGTSAISLLVNSNSQFFTNTLGSDAGGLILPQIGAAAQFCPILPGQQTASLGTISPSFVSQLASLAANRVYGTVASNGAGGAPGTGGILSANGQITKKQTGKYRLSYVIVAANAALGDMTLTFQAANAAAGLAAATTFTHTATVAANGNKITFSGDLIFDGSAGSPLGAALLPASAAGVTFFNFAITAGAGNFIVAAQTGVVALEECG